MLHSLFHTLKHPLFSATSANTLFCSVLFPKPSFYNPSFFSSHEERFQWLCLSLFSQTQNPSSKFPVHVSTLDRFARTRFSFSAFPVPPDSEEKLLHSRGSYRQWEAQRKGRKSSESESDTHKQNSLCFLRSHETEELQRVQKQHQWLRRKRSRSRRYW